MKKSSKILGILIVVLLIALSIKECSGQQNGTFNIVYDNYIQPVFPSTTGLRIRNTVFPQKIYVNDTTLVDYIRHYAPGGGGGTGVSLFVSPTATNHNALDVLTTTVTLTATAYNNTGTVAYEWLNPLGSTISFTNTALATSPGIYTVMASDDVGTATNQIVVYTNYTSSWQSMFYSNTQATVQNPKWITNKNYVDSVAISTTDFNYIPTTAFTIPSGTDSVSTMLHKTTITKAGKYLVNLSGVVRFAGTVSAAGVIINVGFGVNSLSSTTVPNFQNILTGPLNITGTQFGYTINVNSILTLAVGNVVTVNCGYSGTITGGTLQLSAANLTITHL
jgi:hypothetical protein